MQHLDYNAAKKVVYKGILVLGLVTLAEVMIALTGNGHIIPGLYWAKWFMYPAMITLSVYKAYFIIFEFMHMKYEARALRLSVLMPALLLLWAVVAFFWDGAKWGHNRAVVQEKNEEIINKINIPPQPVKKIDMGDSDQQAH